MHPESDWCSGRLLPIISRRPMRAEAQFTGLYSGIFNSGIRLLSNEQHGAGAMTHNLVGDATNCPVDDPTASVCCHHDDIYSQVLGCLNDAIGWRDVMHQNTDIKSFTFEVIFSDFQIAFSYLTRLLPRLNPLVNWRTESHLMRHIYTQHGVKLHFFYGKHRV